MEETLRLARGLTAASGRRLAAARLASHLRAESLLIFVRDQEIDLLVSAPGFPQTLPGGPTWEQFFSRCQSLGVHEGTIAYPDASRRVTYRAVVQFDGVVMLLGGDPVIDEGLEIAAGFLLPMLRAEQIALGSAGRVKAAQEAARHATGLATALDGARGDLERALRAKQEFVAALEATSEERDRLLGIVGHDLRNPLTAILTSAALLARRGNISEEQATVVRRIQRTAERMADMIHGLLDRERIRSAGGLAIEPRETNVSALLQQVIEEAQLAHQQAQFVLVADAGGTTAKWDPTRVAQLLSNLLTNAVLHGNPGSAVRIAARRVDADIVIEVANGLSAPLTADQLSRMFEPFRRGEKSGGLGLGLHIVRAIAVAHGGSVTVESIGNEISFRVVLPGQ